MPACTRSCGIHVDSTIQYYCSSGYIWSLNRWGGLNFWWTYPYLRHASFATEWFFKVWPHLPNEPTTNNFHFWSKSHDIAQTTRNIVRPVGHLPKNLILLMNNKIIPPRLWDNVRSSKECITASHPPKISNVASILPRDTVFWWSLQKNSYRSFVNLINGQNFVKWSLFFEFRPKSAH